MALGREVDRTNHGGGHSGERDEGEQLDKKSRGTTSTRQKAMTRFGRSLACFEIRRGLKAPGHAVLGNFSTDQMVIEFTDISK